MFRFINTNRYLLKYKFYNILLQKYYHAEFLKWKSLIKIEGNNTKEFLQGMITNDITHLDLENKAMYTMLLNVQGRVLFDAILYKPSKDVDTFILECDSSVVQSTVNHLKLHKVRKNVNFRVLDNDFKVLVIYNSKVLLASMSDIIKPSFYIDMPGSGLPSSYINDFPENSIIASDPRLQYLGTRVILPAGYITNKQNITISEGQYNFLRYKFGIGEGVDDLPRGKCLPLEANCDYLHGVSFQKGCYIGQELTARTHHTGVLRKRYMPLVFENYITCDTNAKVLNEKGETVGKLINYQDRYGIGLMRITESLDAETLQIGDCIVKIFKPGWWPMEMSKSKPIT